MNCLQNTTQGRYKMRMDNTRYIIHSHAKTVVCIIDCYIPMLPYNNKIFKEIKDLKSSYYRFQVKGIAKCNPNDTYNEELGMRIAESRAKRKAQYKAARILEIYTTSIYEEFIKAQESLDFFKFEFAKEDTHLMRLIK